MYAVQLKDLNHSLCKKKEILGHAAAVSHYHLRERMKECNYLISEAEGYTSNDSVIKTNAQ